jgi:hypothetical protein
MGAYFRKTGKRASDFSSMKNRMMLSAVKLINSINPSLIGIIVLSKSIK